MKNEETKTLVQSMGELVRNTVQVLLMALGLLSIFWIGVTGIDGISKNTEDSWLATKQAVASEIIETAKDFEERAYAQRCSR
jgi:hypothetical protein